MRIGDSLELGLHEGVCSDNLSDARCLNSINSWLIRITQALRQFLDLSSESSVGGIAKTGRNP